MTDQRSPEFADRLIEAIQGKLSANRPVIEKSRFGRLIWRTNNKGNIEIDLELKL